MHKSMKQTREQIYKAMKNASLVLTELQHDPKKKQHFFLKPSAPIIIAVRPFIREYLAIEIMEKQMPAVIKLGGVREGFNVFVSTISKFPSEDSNQGKYENNKRMEFSIFNAKSNKFK
jgi:hypothetical protein